MQHRNFTGSLALLGALAAGCSDNTPTTPSESVEKIALAREGQVKQVQMMDACDPTSFDAVLGAGACTRSGGITFDKFIELLGQNQSVGAWHFSPSEVTAKVGQVLVALNSGGETHTFTEVEAFGGGIVPDLNILSGNPVPAPECLVPDLAVVPPGGTYSDEVEEEGDELYQCCIHPWMRATVHAH